MEDSGLRRSKRRASGSHVDEAPAGFTITGLCSVINSLLMKAQAPYEVLPACSSSVCARAELLQRSHLLVHRHDPHTEDSELSFLNPSFEIMPNPHQDSDLFSWEILCLSKGLFLLYNQSRALEPGYPRVQAANPRI
nr:putative F-box/kelch-repeat protein At3g17280 [Ipomoea trifida]